MTKGYHIARGNTIDELMSAVQAFLELKEEVFITGGLIIDSTGLKPVYLQVMLFTDIKVRQQLLTAFKRTLLTTDYDKGTLDDYAKPHPEIHF